ncbi:SNF2-related protein [Nonomuraea fuscirosea]|uniref:SNF2-related protein n=1 Tax=Nonomuraea fuscirosea TaxID=1291556 RepID=UPI003720E48F
MANGDGWDIKARRARWDDDQHPRDRKGRWIETGALVRVWGGGRGRVERNVGGGRLEVRFEDGSKLRVHRNYLTVEQPPAGGKPTGRAAARPAQARVEAPSADAEDYTPDAPDSRARVTELRAGDAVLLYGANDAGDDVTRVGVVQAVTPREDGPGHRVQLSSGPVDVADDASARRIPADRLAALNTAIERGEPDADRMARELLDEITAEDDREADGDAPAPAAAGRSTGLGETADRVRAAYDEVARRPGAWVSLADLRSKLGEDLPREQVDEALRRLEREPNVNLVPESNQKTLSAEDRAAAINIGEQDKHLIAFLDNDQPESRADSAAAPAGGAGRQAEEIFPESLQPGDRITFDVPVTEANAERFNTPGAKRPPEPGDLVRVTGVVEGDPEQDMFGGRRIRLADGARWESTAGGIGLVSSRGREWDLEEDRSLQRLGNVADEPERPARTQRPVGDGSQQGGLFADVGKDAAGTEDMFTAAERDREQEEQTAAAAAPQYGGDDGNPPSPEGMTPARRAQLVALIEDDAANYKRTGDPGRYLSETAGENGTPRPGERDWIDAYLSAHPEVLDFTPEEREQRKRERAERQQAGREQAKTLSRQAREAFDEGRHDEALSLIDQAEEADPTGRNWQRVREQIATRRDRRQEQPAPPAREVEQSEERFDQSTADANTYPGKTWGAFNARMEEAWADFGWGLSGSDPERLRPRVERYRAELERFVASDRGRTGQRRAERARDLLAEVDRWVAAWERENGPLYSEGRDRSENEPTPIDTNRNGSATVRDTMRGANPAPAPADETEGAPSERVREDSDAPLGDLPAAGPGRAGEPDAVLRGPGPTGGGGDREPVAGPGRTAAGREPGLPGDDGPQPDGDGAGEGSRDAGDGVPARRTRPGGRRAAQRREPSRVAARTRFRPESQDDLAPAGEKAKARANIAAVKTLRALQESGRQPTEDERRTLARWSGWGSVPVMFAGKPKRANYKDDGAHARAVAKWESFASERDELRAMLDDKEWRAASKNTLNAHYTDAGLVGAVWEAVQGLGFDGGNVLEPGSGVGTFIGMAPERARMIGVELDPTTAAISKMLYPHAEVRNESFADTRAPDGSFDAVVGNVPFGKYTLTDREHNKAGHSIHNHFILKSLAMARPGGLVAVITSRYTMDSQDSKARRDMAAMGDLVGAVRLPAGAHQRAAGTDVVTDLLIFRKRGEGEQPVDLSWVDAPPMEVGGAEFPVNNYFQAHPEHVLGELAVGRGQFTAQDLTVRGDKNAAAAMRTALAGIVSRANAEGRGYQQRADNDPPVELRLADSVQEHEGYIAAAEDGTFTQVSGGAVDKLDVHPSQAEQLQAFMGLRDVVAALLDEEASADAETPRMRALRAELNRRYRDFVGRYEAISKPRNRIYTPAEAKAAAEAEGRRVEDADKVATAAALFRQDPASAMVFALDRWDADTKTARPADIMSKRVVATRKGLPDRAEDAGQALAHVIDFYQEVRLDEIARLLDVDEAEARSQLGTRVFNDPARSGRLVVAAEYLSGNVRKKLEVAREAAEDDPTLLGNVAALEKVLPRDLTPGEIDAKMGAPWISEKVVQEFLQDILGTRGVQVEHAGGSTWAVKGPTYGIAVTSTWGTEERPAPDIAEALLQQRTIKVTKTVKINGEKRTVPDPDATIAAQEKAQAMGERFAEWVWEDPDRAARLARIYNDRFNSVVLRSYDDADPALPGLADGWTPRPHQKAAVARILSEPSVLLAHEVGAGKTAEMVMGAMELRRTGLARKPAIVIPNHMLEQFSREFLEIYPQAKILTASSEDLQGDKRREFVARAATGDWDAVILTQRAFEKIDMRPEAQEEYMNAELNMLREQIARAKEREGKSLVLKDLERKLATAEEKLKAKLDGMKDEGAVYFEQTGIDYLMVDEAHHYKNLRTASVIEGASIDGSNRASDLHMKLHYLRSTSTSGRVVTLATGTPIANSVTEAYTMQRYLRPDLLEDAGLEDFDSWAATFGEIVTDIELNPDGNGFRQKARFSKFRNVPELIRLYRIAADVKTAADLNLPTPPVRRDANGNRGETVVIPASDEQLAYIAELGKRAEAIRNGGVDPSEDNMLKISGDGKRAALDMRLIDPGAESVGGKVDVASDRIAAIFHETKNHVYPIHKDDPTPHPTPGALQIVFMDQGTPQAKTSGPKLRKREVTPAELTPGLLLWDRGRARRILAVTASEDGTRFQVDVETAKGSKRVEFVGWDAVNVSHEGDFEEAGEERWSAYDTMREQLIARGVPAEKIRYIHEANTDQQKAKLFEDARTGKIAVLIGSTEKMGVGTNVQARAVALHHMDCPWRPADLAQRDGRIERQGNFNLDHHSKDVQILRYVTEGTFDGYSWQTVERKAKFIAQLQRGNLDVREIEDVGDAALSFAEVKALATGNPYLLDKAQADADLNRLVRLDRAWSRNQAGLEQAVRDHTENIRITDMFIADWQAALDARTDTRGDAFTMTLGGTTFTKRADAYEPLRQAAADHLAMRPWVEGKRVQIGELGGHPVYAETGRDGQNNRTVKVGFDWPRGMAPFRQENLGEGGGRGMMATLEKRLAALEDQIAAGRVQIDTSERERDRAQRGIGKPFPHADTLRDTRVRSRTLNELINAITRRDELKAVLREGSSQEEKDKFAQAEADVQVAERRLADLRPAERPDPAAQPDPDLTPRTTDPVTVVSADDDGEVVVDRPDDGLVTMPDLIDDGDGEDLDDTVTDTDVGDVDAEDLDTDTDTDGDTDGGGLVDDRVDETSILEGQDQPGTSAEPEPDEQPEVVPDAGEAAGVAARPRTGRTGRTGGGGGGGGRRGGQGQPGRDQDEPADQDPAEGEPAPAAARPAPEGVAPAEQRAPAPDGQVYGDQIKPGDTIAVPRVAGVWGGRRVSARGTYVQPGGPARIGNDTVPRTVTEVTPTSGGQGVKVTLDDGRTVSLRADELVGRGDPAEVRNASGQRVGEWVSHKRVEFGDRISYTVPGQNLPASFDRAAFGVGRFDEVRVSGIVGVRQPGMPYGELTEVTVRLPDGTLVPVERMRGRWPERVILLDPVPGEEDRGDAPAPAAEGGPDPSTPPAADLVPGDRLPGVPGGGPGVVERTERPGDGLTHVTVRTDDDARHVRPIPDERPVTVVDEPAQPTVDTTEVVGLAVGDWFVDDDGQALRVVSEPVVDGDRARFDVATTEGGTFEVESDRGAVVARTSGPDTVGSDTPASVAADLDEDQAAGPPPLPDPEPPARVPVTPVGDVATGRVRLRTAQRRRILELDLDAQEAPVDADVAQAAARLRARQPLTGRQMRALAGHLRTLGEDESLPGARRRSHQRTAAWVDAAYARLSGFPAPPHDPGRDAPEKAYAGNLTMGDTIALPDNDGGVVFGTITARKTIRGFGLVQVHVRMADGSVQQRIIPEKVDVWVMPDLPPDREVPPTQDADGNELGFEPEEHIHPSRIEVGDAIRYPIGGGRYPIANVRSIRRTSRPFAGEEEWQAELAVLDERDQPIHTETVTLSSAGRPTVVRTFRGPGSQDQPWEGAFSYDGDGRITADQMQVGDRVTITTGEREYAGFVETLAPVVGDDMQQTGVTAVLRGYDGDIEWVPLGDGAEILRHSRGGSDAPERIRAEQDRMRQAGRERDVARVLAYAETSVYRQTAARLLGELDTRPLVPAQEQAGDEVYSQALARLEEVLAAEPDGLVDELVDSLTPDTDEQAGTMRARLAPLVGEVRERAAANLVAAISEIDPLPGESWDQALRRAMLQYRDMPPSPSLATAGRSLAAVELDARPAPLPDLPDAAGDVAARMAAYRAALPEDPANLGRRPVERTVFRPTTLADLEAGRVPETDTVTTWADDGASDGGPGEHAMRHLAVLRAAGRDLDALYQARLAEAGVDGLNERYEELGGRLQAAYEDAYVADRDVQAALLRNRRDVADQFGYGTWRDLLREADDSTKQQARAAGLELAGEEVRERDAAVARYKQIVAELMGTRRQLGEARRAAALSVLAQVRDFGGDGVDYLNANGRPLTDRSRLLEALRIAEAGYPSDWLAAARDAGPVLVEEGNGSYERVPGFMPRIRLPWESETYSVLRGGRSQQEKAPSKNIGGNDATRGAVHEFGHHMTEVVPGLAAAEWAFKFDRTSTGDIGERQRTELRAGKNGASTVWVREGGFASPYAGREYEDGSSEVFTVGVESLLGGSEHLDNDDDYRAFMFGALALAGTGQEGPRVSPLSGVELSELSETQLRALLADVWGNQAEMDQVLAELERRNLADDQLAGVDLEALEIGDLAKLLGEVDDDYAIARISQAMERWEAQQAEIEAEDRAEVERNARVDQLVAEGVSEMEAWAQVHGLSYEELARQQNDGQFDRLPGETRDQTARRHYDLWLHQQYLRAAEETNGYLVNAEGVAAGVDEKSLFSGRRDRARKYATEELRRWWDANGWMNFTEFKAQMLQREQDRRAAAAGRAARDFNR